MLQQKKVKGQSGGGNKISYKAIPLHCIPLLSFTQPPVLFIRPPIFYYYYSYMRLIWSITWIILWRTFSIISPPVRRDSTVRLSISLLMKMIASILEINACALLGQEWWLSTTNILENPLYLPNRPWERWLRSFASPTLGVGTLRSRNGNTRVCPERVVFSGAPPDQPGGGCWREWRIA